MDTESTRPFVSDVTRDLAALDGAESSERAERLETLRASWGRLVQHLALGEAPEVRQCPACDGRIAKAATRCMHCWTRSTAPAETPATKRKEEP